MLQQSTSSLAPKDETGSHETMRREPTDSETSSTQQPLPPDSSQKVPASQPDTATPFPVFEPTNRPGRSTAHVQKHRKKLAVRTYLVVSAVAVVAVLLFVFVSSLMSKKPMPVQTATNPTTDEPKSEVVEDELDTPNPTANDYARLGSPTKGPPIELRYIPFGAEVVIHLRPAELWRESSLEVELRACVPPLFQFLKATIQDLYQCSPSQIDELLICLIPGSRGDFPEVAAVAHFSSDHDESQFAERFGRRDDSYERPIYAKGERAYLLIDSKTIVVCPKSQIDEMLKAIDVPHPLLRVDSLLPTTDRDRQVTLIISPLTLRLYETWFPENVRPLLNAVSDWLGEHVEALSWSFHLTPELFYSEIVIKDKQGVVKKRSDDIQSRLATLAEKLVQIVQQMDPKEYGKRMIIGRFPAMIEVFSMATVFERSPRQVRLITSLPDRAAPNLLLGSFLTWEESNRTDFSKPAPTLKEAIPLPSKIADRLNLKIDVNFQAVPFSEAFTFLSNEIATPIDIDGDALKAGGFTKNLKQTFQMDAVRVQDVIVKIFTESKGIDANPEKCLVIIVNENEKRMLVTTKSVAIQKGLVPFEIGKDDGGRSKTE